MLIPNPYPNTQLAKNVCWQGFRPLCAQLTWDWSVAISSRHHSEFLTFRYCCSIQATCSPFCGDFLPHLPRPWAHRLLDGNGLSHSLDDRLTSTDIPTFSSFSPFISFCRTFSYPQGPICVNTPIWAHRCFMNVCNIALSNIYKYKHDNQVLI